MKHQWSVGVAIVAAFLIACGGSVAGDQATDLKAPAVSPHGGHGVTQQVDAHGAHGSAESSAADQVGIAAPRTNAALGQLKPGSTLQPDAFDAARPAPIAEAVKAREPMDHSGHTRGITAGEDEANPPTPMPATRDGNAFVGASAPSAAGHEHAGATSTASPAAEAVYSCPMHPEVTSDKPGTCPKCGMALVKKK